MEAEEAEKRSNIDLRIKQMQDRIEAMLGKSDRQTLEEQISMQRQQDEAAAEILADNVALSPDFPTKMDERTENNVQPEDWNDSVDNDRFVIM